MITDEQEYKEYLKQIQDSKSTVYTTLPTIEPRFIINANTREITIPPVFKFLAAQYDHQAETIYFEIDRYYDNVDLSKKICIVQYSNKGSNGGISEGFYRVTKMDTVSVDGKIIFGWAIESNATKYVGDIVFSVRFYSIDSNNEFSYNFNTISAYSTIADSLQIYNNSDYVSVNDYELWIAEADKVDANIQSALNEVENLAEEVERNTSLSETYKNNTEELLNQARTQANVATEQANISKSQVELAKTQVQIATEQADESTEQANISKSQATIATEQADIASQKAYTASTKASVATTQAETATQQAEIASSKAQISTEQANISIAQANVATEQANISKSQAEISTEQALLSKQYSEESKAQADISTNKATVATTQANIATEKANEASTYLNSVKANADIATEKATEATNQANIAKEQAELATAKAEITTEQAIIATEKASEAATQAEIATTQANESKAQAELSKGYSDEAKLQAETSTEQANVASDKADEATEQATIAIAQAVIATEQAELAAEKVNEVDSKIATLGNEYLTKSGGDITGNLNVSEAVTAKTFNSSVATNVVEFRESEAVDAGYVLVESGNGVLTLSTERLNSTGVVISDTYGFSMAQSESNTVPVVITGRVLVYPYEEISTYAVGSVVCTAPDGKVSAMTSEEILANPHCILGVVTEIPTYETWNDIAVNGRIWIKIK